MQTWDAYSYRPPGSKSEYIVTFYTGLYFVTFMMETLMILPYRLKTLTLKSICYEKAGDWPNKNRNFTVQN